MLVFRDGQGVRRAAGERRGPYCIVHHPVPASEPYVLQGRLSWMADMEKDNNIKGVTGLLVNIRRRKR
jgi:hypothetical protein